MHFLKFVSISKFEKNFREQGWDDLTELMKWKPEDRKKKFESAGISAGAINKFNLNVNHYNQYRMKIEVKESPTYSEVLNDVMPLDWKPDKSKGHVDRNEEFKDDKNKISVRGCVNKLLDGYILEGTTSEDKDLTFYILSSSQKRWYKITPKVKV